MVVLLTGNNAYAIKRRLDGLVKKFIAKHGELALERLDAEEIEAQQIIEAAQSLPFLSAKKLLILRGLSANKLAAEKIEQIISSTDEATDLIIHDPAPDKRSSYYKFLKQQPGFEEHNPAAPNELPGWLIKEAKARGGQLSPADARYLVERIGPNQLMLSNELDKLLIYEPNISHQSIDLLTDETPQSKVFDLLDAAFAGQKAKALKLYEQQRLLKVEPQMILAMIGWQLQVLAVLKTAEALEPGKIAADSGLNPYVLRKAAPLARRLSLEQVKDLVGQALEMDYKNKIGKLDLDEALKNYLITI